MWSTPDAAIMQIKQKEYCEKLKKENVSQILAVGINYDIREKEHQCVIEDHYIGGAWRCIILHIKKPPTYS